MSANHIDIERRTSQRFLFKHSVSHRFSKSRKWNVSECSNISLGGIMFLSPENILKGTMVELKIGNGNISINPVIMNACSVWSLPLNDRNSYSNGFMFCHSEETQKKYIEYIINNIMGNGISSFEEELNNKTTILIIEDEENFREILSDCLKLKKHFNVITAQNGMNGLKLCKEQKPHLIILDLNLPDIYGYDLIKIIENFSSEYGKPKIVVLTAQTGVRSILFNNTGIADFISKPVSLHTLLKKIDALIIS